MGKTIKLVNKKEGDCFYRHIWKTLNIGDTVKVCKGNHIFNCVVSERCGIEKYKLEIVDKGAR